MASGSTSPLLYRTNFDKQLVDHVFKVSMRDSELRCLATGDYIGWDYINTMPIHSEEASASIGHFKLIGHTFTIDRPMEYKAPDYKRLERMAAATGYYADQINRVIFQLNQPGIRRQIMRDE